MNDITALAHRAPLDFTQPLETESGEPVKYICSDVIEYKCARICVDAATGIVYSSPYAGLKIRNTSQYVALRRFTEEAASAYSDFENGFISDMKCGDRSHEYLMFVKEPKNVLALVEALEKAQTERDKYRSRLSVAKLFVDNADNRIAELESRTVTEPQQKKLIGWRMADYTHETSDPECARNWAPNVQVLPIFEGDINTHLCSHPTEGEVQ